MSNASDTPVTRKYTRREVNTGELPIEQHADIDISVGKEIVHGSGIVDVAGDIANSTELINALAFNEEPITIIIHENSRSEHPETHVPVSINGKGAEVLSNGRWLEIGWLPINQELTTKRKYVEVLMRCKSESVRTVHQSTDVERPINTVSRKTSSSYPVQIIDDRNPLGREWASRIMMSH